VTALYPFLLAAARVLFRADRNAGYYTPGDLVLILLAVLLLLFLVYAAAARLFRGRGEGMPALVTFITVLWLFGFDPGARSLPNLPHHLSYLLLGLAGLVASVVVVWWLGRRPATLRTVSLFLTLTGTLLVLRSAAGVALDLRRERATVARSALVRRLAEPIRASGPARGPARDVYLIVLDEYANEEVLRDGLGFDNRPFLDSLRGLGFYVPKAVSSNYTMTMHSLPSLLNAAHMYPAERDFGTDGGDPTLANHLLGESRVAGFLRSRGYRVVFFPSLWWVATSALPGADSTVRVWHGFNLDRALATTDFRRSVREETLIDYLHMDEPYDGDFVRRTLGDMARLPSVDAPVFAFAHVLSPHWPIVFDRECRARPRSARNRDRIGDYTGQLTCLNRMVLETVTHLVRDSKVAPIILLQGDHGSQVHGFRTADTAETLSATAAWERFGAFGAYYLPDGGEAAFGDTVTVVNVLGDVLRHYFGADLPREPDDHYVSVEAEPYHFVHVEPAWVAAGDTVRSSRDAAGAATAR
jgi:hypothetical protein